MSLSVGNFKASERFTKDWTVFYWAFWLAWVSVYWNIYSSNFKRKNDKRIYFCDHFSAYNCNHNLVFCFANSAFEIVKNSSISQFDNVFTSLFIFLEHYPLSIITVFSATILVLVSIINSVDSAIFVLGIFSDHGKEDPSKKHKIFWGIIITASAIGLSAVGSNDLLNAISNLLIILALPFSLLYLFIIISFVNKLIKKQTK